MGPSDAYAPVKRFPGSCQQYNLQHREKVCSFQMSSLSSLLPPGENCVLSFLYIFEPLFDGRSRQEMWGEGEEDGMQ